MFLKNNIILKSFNEIYGVHVSWSVFLLLFSDEAPEVTKEMLARKSKTSVH